MRRWPRIAAVSATGGAIAHTHSRIRHQLHPHTLVNQTQTCSRLVWSKQSIKKSSKKASKRHQDEARARPQAVIHLQPPAISITFFPLTLVLMSMPQGACGGIDILPSHTCFNPLMALTHPCTCSQTPTCARAHPCTHTPRVSGGSVEVDKRIPTSRTWEVCIASGVHQQVCISRCASRVTYLSNSSLSHTS